MNILVWQWGRRGAGPRFAAELADALRSLPGIEAHLSLAEAAELLSGHNPPQCDWAVATYRSVYGLAGRLLRLPIDLIGVVRRLRQIRPDIAVCAMAAPLDLLMAAGLAVVGCPFVMLVHDADPHPGDLFPLQTVLHGWVLRRAAAVGTLSQAVAQRLRARGEVGARPLLVLEHPPWGFGTVRPPRAHGGKWRVLSFGRLLPYKGLDLLLAGLQRLGGRADMDVRVVGSGPDSAALDGLRALPGVTVENRWVPEDELAAVLGWSDVIVLSHTEASQSGVAAAALATGRYMVATRVGGMAEQLAGAPMARLCDPTPDSLAAALTELLDHPPPPVATAPDHRGAWQAMARALVDGIRQIGR